MDVDTYQLTRHSIFGLQKTVKCECGRQRSDTETTEALRGIGLRRKNATQSNIEAKQVDSDVTYRLA